MDQEPKQATGEMPAATRPKRDLMWGALVLLLLVCVGGLWRWWKPGDDVPGQMKPDRVLRIGYAVEAPYAFLKPDGRVSGEGPEIARVIAARLGKRVEWRLTEFGSLIDGLEAGRYDVIAAARFITPERSGRVRFSRPTFQAGPALLVRKGNPLGLHSFQDLAQHTNARVAVLNHSVEQALVRRAGCRDSRVIVVPDALSGLAAVQRGQAEALALSAPAVRWMSRPPNSESVEAAEPFEAGAGTPAGAWSLGGFVFRKDQRDLLKAWDAALAGYIGSAEHCRLMRGFGFSAAELPPRLTHEPNQASP